MNASSRSGSATPAAYGAAVLFALHLITYFIPAVRDVTPSSSLPLAETLAVLAVAEHLIVFPIIAALPAPGWAKAAGYGWLVLDIASEIMQVNGGVKVTFLSLRYGANIAAAVWIAASSWQESGAIRVIGIIVALTLAIYSFVAFLPFTFLMLVPSLILLPLWFVLVGRSLSGKQSISVKGVKEDQHECKF